eukprot:scaffold1265_cov366-Prasinococcus_capsulatus_cf.AAC.15
MDRRREGGRCLPNGCVSDEVDQCTASAQLECCQTRDSDVGRCTWSLLPCRLELPRRGPRAHRHTQPCRSWHRGPVVG